MAKSQYRRLVEQGLSEEQIALHIRREAYRDGLRDGQERGRKVLEAASKLHDECLSRYPELGNLILSSQIEFAVRAVLDSVSDLRALTNTKESG